VREDRANFVATPPPVVNEAPTPVVPRVRTLREALDSPWRDVAEKSPRLLPKKTRKRFFAASEVIKY
jgi:hypothetical protein